MNEGQQIKGPTLVEPTAQGSGASATSSPMSPPVLRPDEEMTAMQLNVSGLGMLFVFGSAKDITRRIKEFKDLVDAENRHPEFMTFDTLGETPAETGTAYVRPESIVLLVPGPSHKEYWHSRRSAEMRQRIQQGGRLA